MAEAPAWQFLVGAAVLLLAAAACSLLSAAIERSGPIRLRRWGEHHGGSIERMLENPSRFAALQTSLAWVAKAVLVLSVLVAAYGLSQMLPTIAQALGIAAIVNLFVLLLVEIAARILILRAPERTLDTLVPLFRASLLVLAPLAWPLTPLMPDAEQAGRRDEEEEDVSEEDLDTYIAVGTREGILDDEGGEWVRRVIEFRDTSARSVMTPRIDIIAAPTSTSLEELAERFVDSGHARLPLYRDSVDRIVGILHIRDLVGAMRQATPTTDATKIAREPFFVPDSKPLGDLLEELQLRRQQMAIVVDEYGGVAGLVTVEDLLEEIVGELADEHDEDEAVAQPLPGGGWLLSGGVTMDELEKLFDVDLDEIRSETLGGLVFSLIGDVPSAGAEVQSMGLRFVVETVEERRIQTVRVEPWVVIDQGEAG